MALKEGDGKTGGQKGGPTGENRETLWEKKTSVPTVRRRDIGKMSVLTRQKGKRN
jgi:hypothetical protein